MPFQKQQNDPVHFQCKPLDITVTQVYVSTSDTEEPETEWFYEDLKDLLELTPKKVSFSLGGTGMQKCKSRDTWSNRQVWS